MILTDAATWEQLPADADRLLFLQFKPGGGGHLVSSSGPSIALDVEFDWEARDGELELRFRDSPYGFRRTDENGVRVVRFELVEGAHTFYVPHLIADVTYRWKLRFDRSPLPSDAAKYHQGADPTRFTEFFGVPVGERRYSTGELTAIFDKLDGK